VTLPSTASVADAEYVTIAPLGPVAPRISVGGTPITGGVVSATVTWKLALPLFPDASEAVHVTVVGPNGKKEPDGGVHEAATVPSTASDADAENVTGAPPGPVAARDRLPGTLTTGGVVSLTVIWKLALPLFPAASEAVHVTVVVPIGNVAPEGGAHVTATAPSTLSDAETVNKTVDPPAPVAEVEMSGGTVITGGDPSLAGNVQSLVAEETASQGGVPSTS
jgi:nitrogen fixation protein